MTHTPPIRTVLITGAARRIGAQIATDLAMAGYHVIIHYHHSNTPAKRLQTKLKQSGKQVDILHANLSDLKQITQIVSNIYKKHARLDWIINNASTFLPSTLKTFTTEQLRYEMTVNLFAPILLTHALESRNPQGHVTNITDQKHENALDEKLIYALSKQYLYTFSHNCRPYLSNLFRVNQIALGYILPSADLPDTEPLLDQETQKERLALICDTLIQLDQSLQTSQCINIPGS